MFPNVKWYVDIAIFVNFFNSLNPGLVRFFDIIFLGNIRCVHGGYPFSYLVSLVSNQPGIDPGGYRVISYTIS
jgi:hypothetical protein